MLSNAPSLHTFKSLAECAKDASSSRDGETWHPARPLGFYSFGHRLALAWLVFTGRADAFVWPDNQ